MHPDHSCHARQMTEPLWAVWRCGHACPAVSSILVNVRIANPTDAVADLTTVIRHRPHGPRFRTIDLDLLWHSVPCGPISGRTHGLTGFHAILPP